MQYSNEFKLKCAEMYREGKYPDTPEGISKIHFHKEVRHWVRVEEAAGQEALKYKNHNRIWTAEERRGVVAKVLAGQSIESAAVSVGIIPELLYQWVRRYNDERIRKQIRKRGFRNEAFSTLGKVIDRLCDTIKNLPADAIGSITGRFLIASVF